MKVLKMISYEEADKIVAEKGETIGGLGGWFNNGHRWKDFVEQMGFSDIGKEYAEAFRAYIIANKIKHGGDWHQNDDEGAPLFDDGNSATFSYRAWGDFFAAVWSEFENRDYSYMSFYMDSLIPPEVSTGV